MVELIDISFRLLFSLFILRILGLVIRQEIERDERRGQSKLGALLIGVFAAVVILFQVWFPGGGDPDDPFWRTTAADFR